MDKTRKVQIISFYEFKDMSEAGALDEIRERLKTALIDFGVRGTIIIANEGFNGMVCGAPDQMLNFVSRTEEILQTRFALKSSFHERAPFRKIDVKIKPEIVTLKQQVEISLGK